MPDMYDNKIGKPLDSKEKEDFLVSRWVDALTELEAAKRDRDWYSKNCNGWSILYRRIRDQVGKSFGIAGANHIKDAGCLEACIGCFYNKVLEIENHKDQF